MFHKIACPECGQTLQVPDDLIGAAVQCPQCLHAFTASAPETPISAVPLPPPPPPPVKKPRPPREDRADRVRMGRIAKPGQVTSLGVLALAGGVMAILVAVGLGGVSAGACCLWPGTYYSLVVGILGIIRGAALLGHYAHLEPPPRTLAILMIINIINGDFVCLTLGIIMLTICHEKEVTAYLRRPAAVN